MDRPLRLTYNVKISNIVGIRTWIVWGKIEPTDHSTITIIFFNKIKSEFIAFSLLLIVVGTVDPGSNLVIVNFL